MKLTDGSLSATGSYNADYGPQYARIGAPQVSGKAHGWAGKKTGDAITVDLTSSYVVTGVATQGRG